MPRQLVNQYLTRFKQVNLIKTQVYEIRMRFLSSQVSHGSFTRESVRFRISKCLFINGKMY